MCMYFLEIWIYLLLFNLPMLDSEVWGFGWNKVLTHQIFAYSYNLFYGRSVNSDLARSASFAKFGISCLGPIFMTYLVCPSGWLTWFLSDCPYGNLYVSDELYWCSHRQKNIGEQASWSNGLLNHMGAMMKCWNVSINATLPAVILTARQCPDLGSHRRLVIGPLKFIRVLYSLQERLEGVIFI